MKIKPLYDNIVLAAGCGVDDKMLVKEGDVVLFPANAVIKAKVNGEEVSIITQSDVLAVVE